MKSAVMQPYLFPYLGYYQLVNSVDKFVFYNDVNFIKKGYVNRNNILHNGHALRFTVPIPKASQNKKINELSFDENVNKVLKTIKLNYTKAPFFKEVYPIIESVLTDKNRSVDYICSRSVKDVLSYLEIKKSFYLSSDLNHNRELSAKDRLIDMSKLLGCPVYINSPGGKDLYNKEYFSSKDIKLSFIEIDNYCYEQNCNEFVPHLSIIDVLMWNDKQQVLKLLNMYKLV